MSEQEYWTLKAAAEFADERYSNIIPENEAELRREMLWFQIMVQARTGEQVERVANALERIAVALEKSQQKEESHECKR